MQYYHQRKGNDLFFYFPILTKPVFMLSNHSRLWLGAHFITDALQPPYEEWRHHGSVGQYVRLKPWHPHL